MPLFDKPVPVHLQGRAPSRSLTQAATQGMGVARPPRIGIKGGRFTVYTGDGKPVPWQNISIDVVVVDVLEHTSRLFWGRNNTYTDDSRDPPLCFSDNGIGPSANAFHPQSPFCEGCPQNERGQTQTFNGFDTTFCRVQKKIAVIIPGDPDPNAVYEFVIGPGSMGNWKKYVGWLVKQSADGQAIELYDVLTRITPEGYIVNFGAVDYTTPQDNARVAHVETNHLGDDVLNRDDRPADPETVKRLLAMGGMQGAPRGQEIALPPQRPPQQAAPPPSAQQGGWPAQGQTIAPPPPPPPAQGWGAPPPAAAAPPQEARTPKRSPGRPRKPKDEAADPVAAGHQAPAAAQPSPQQAAQAGSWPQQVAQGGVTHGNMQQPYKPPSALEEAMRMQVPPLPPAN